MPRVDDDAWADEAAGRARREGKARPAGACPACGGKGTNSKGGPCYPCQMTGRAKDRPPKEDRKR